MNYFSAPHSKAITRWETILELVCEDWGISKADLLSDKHNPEFAQPRQVAIWLMKVHGDVRGKELENIFNRGHSVISRSCTKVINLMSVYPEYKQRLLKIENLL